MTRIPRHYVVAAAAGLMIAVIAGLALTGRPPGSHDIGHFEAQGIVALQQSAIVKAEIRTGKDRVGFRRNETGSWILDRPEPVDLSSELASHLESALRFMQVSAPTRTLDPDEYHGTSFADFGLDPPAYLVSLAPADQSAVVVDFGALNPAKTSQYVRMVGQPRLYLMPRHVGAEWELTADMARRIAPPDGAVSGETAGRSASLLLPASIEKVWAVELVVEGKLHRFERDGAGDWFLHVGQHIHSGGVAAHVADPAKASVIAAALAAFDQTQIEALVAHHPDPGQIERYGLARPVMIALIYARDNSSPLARIEIGNMAADGFGRYARLADGGDVVTIAAFEAGRLIELLKAVGAAS